jgi:hypothetical protein
MGLELSTPVLLCLNFFVDCRHSATLRQFSSTGEGDQPRHGPQRLHQVPQHSRNGHHQHPHLRSAPSQRSGTGQSGYNNYLGFVHKTTKHFQLPSTFNYQALSITKYFQLPSTFNHQVLSITKYFQLPSTFNYQVLSKTNYF